MRWSVGKAIGLMVSLFVGVSSTAAAAPPSEYDCGSGQPDRQSGTCKCPPTMRAARDGNDAAVCVLKRKPHDPDGDGLSAPFDRCPKDPEDRDGFQDGDGCPERDDDGDGLADVVDRCPREAEDRDGDADEDGCPEDAATESPLLPGDDATPAGTTPGDAARPHAPRPLLEPDDDVQDLPAPVRPAPDRGRTQRRIAYAVAGAGLVSFAVSATYGFMAQSSWNSVTSDCTDQGTHLECDPAGRRASADARSAAQVSNITFAVGSTALIASAIVYLTAPAATPTSVGVGTTRGGATLTYTRSF
jgi:hypothetical protein